MNFIPAEYYNTIYLFIVLFLSVIFLSKYNKRVGANIYQTPVVSGSVSFWILIFFVLFIGFRPISEVFVDMTAYVGRLNRWSGPWDFRWDVENFLYDNFLNYCCSIELNPIIFYTIISTIYFGCMYAACKKLFPYDCLVAFIICLGAFSTFSYGTNGIKNGSATSIFLLAMAYRDKLKIAIPLAIVSLGFHHAMQLPIAAFFSTIFYRKPKYYFAFWIFCLLMAVGHVGVFQTLFAGLSDEKGEQYLESEFGYGTVKGFRIDFVFYSAMPVLLGWIAYFKKKVRSVMYETLLCSYLLTNGIWMLCMYAEYTNRIAYLSWFMYPIVLVYPILMENWTSNRYQFFCKVAYAHLAFTMLIYFILY